ncbi:MAG: alpha/beta fold hydrolase [Eubacteriales bacterium]|nr:alpha/beta fold hydrolase [Eubacteriales bacterium]
MNQKVEKLLENRGGNYIFPFFWQHGESEEVLREYMKVIHESNIGAVCVESRPHPDFLGEKWWKDMDVILDEARKRDMKVWILDDSHFPTGYANGAMEKQDISLRRQSLVMETVACTESGTVMELSLEDRQSASPWKPTAMDAWIKKELPFFSDDCLVSVTAIREGGSGEEDLRDLSGQIPENRIRFEVPEGKWKLALCYLTRNRGPHRDYINMMDAASCRVLIDTVYEPHYQHYGEDFGKTIAGFFSDEPEIGNGHLYETGKKISELDDQAWSREVEAELKQCWGERYALYLPLIWEQPFESDLCAKARYDYMNAVTKAVKRDFSYQIGDWCREHGVEYIGHLIEDNNQHSRTGSSLGHYFRGLAGQDMAGIDDIVGQVLPQREEGDAKRDGHFYHYALGKLAASAAALEPLKKGRSMCEVFGAYGWSEGVHLEKYLLDHFLVRGINHYVPHAFSAKEFPDPDCPPHFYAHGNNPQYRHFGKLMAYGNRVCELINDGRHIAPVGILYQGESDWCGSAMMMQEPAVSLADGQIDYDFIPSDVFADRAAFGTEVSEKLHVNGQMYEVLVVPAYDYITKEAAEGMAELQKQGGHVIFIDQRPKGICSGEGVLPAELKDCLCVKLDELLEVLESLSIREIEVVPGNRYLRYLHYQYYQHRQNGSDLYLLSNEGAKPYTGEIRIRQKGRCYAYNAWDNRLETLQAEETEEGTVLRVCLEPLKPLIVVFDETARKLEEPILLTEARKPFISGWKRSICRSIDYPNFKEETSVSIPDRLAEENPTFSGFVRYTNHIFYKKETELLLEIQDAAEGVEVFVNGESAGIQIAPPYRYDLTGLLHEGENELCIEVATTLEREMYPVTKKGPVPTCGSGITGTIYLEECGQKSEKSPHPLQNIESPRPLQGMKLPIPLQDMSMLDSRGFLYAGGAYTEVDGKQCFAGQMYVEVYVPKEIRHPYPVLFLHGAAQTGSCWMYAPDGRPGWAWDFLNQGYVVYVADQPERGRSACHRTLRGERYTFSTQEIVNSFTGPSAVEGCAHTQWPGGENAGYPGDPVFDAFYASQVDCLVGIAETQELVRDAACALLDQAGPMIVIGHSQAGPCVWEIGDARPDLVKAMIAVEPSGPPFVNIQTGKPQIDETGHPTNWGIAHLPLTFEPPIQTAGDLRIRPFRPEETGGRPAAGYLQTEPARKLKNLTGIPTLLLTSECSYHAAFDWQTAAFLTQAGVPADYLHLPDLGIHGNGHMMMLEKNSAEIAGLLADWLTKKAM